MAARCLLVLMMVVAAGAGQGLVEPEAPAPTASYREASHSTRDNFTGRIPDWTQLLAPLQGRPELRYLGIGVDQGRSALWVLENLLTDQTSSMVAVDTFHLEWVRKGYQAVLKKHDNPCADRYLCTPLGDRHLYLWRQVELWDVPGERKLPLSDAEHAALREALRDHGNTPPLEPLASDPRLEGFVGRLAHGGPEPR